MAKVELCVVTETLTLLEAMRAMNASARGGGPAGMLLVAPGGVVRAVVTDGDIRRALSRGLPLDATLDQVMVRDPITVRAGLDPVEMMRLMVQRVQESGRIHDTKVDKLIVVDEAGRLVDVLGLADLVRDTDSRFRTVCVVGMGFVGLTLSVSLCEAGFLVRGVERDDHVRARLRAGEPHFHEVGLASLLRHHLERGHLVVERDFDSLSADVYTIAVGTPLGEDRMPRLDDVREAAAAVGERLKRGDLVVLRSTLPVGACREVLAPLLAEVSGLRPGADFSLAYAPERTVEGRALFECRTIPQILGGLDAQSLRRAANLFSGLTPTLVQVSSLEAAEMAKLLNNSYRDLSFSFANEFALVCDRLALDAVEIIQAANEGYPRDRVPLPSPGVGGPCLTKDPYIYAAVADRAGVRIDLPALGRRINERMPAHVLSKIDAFMRRTAKDPARGKLLVLGLAFKGDPETSDVRESPAVELLRLAGPSWAEVVAHDPVVAEAEFGRLGVRRVSVDEGFAGADAAVVMTNHPALRDLDLFRLLPTMRAPAYLLDGWRLYSRRDVEAVPGLTYGSLSLG
jgi:UDP-N-acetyl-D-mannosaminuronic acid dehydrogenase